MIRTNSNNTDQVITDLSISGNINLPGITGGTAASSVLVINNTTGRIESRTVLQLGGSSGSSGTSGFLNTGGTTSVPYYSSGWVLNGTNLTHDGTNTGIGTPVPTAILHVTGTPRIDSSAGTRPDANDASRSPIKYVGIDETVYLSMPSEWLTIIIDGTSYRIPAFI